MATIGVTQEEERPIAPVGAADAAVRRILLACGMVASILYTAMNVFIPLQWAEYDFVSRTVGELWEIGAPTRLRWNALGMVHTLLLTAFGWGVRAAAVRNRHLRVAANLMIAHGIIGLFWPARHLQGSETSLADALHSVWSVAALLLMLLAVGFGAAALGRGFRLYSVATFAVLVVFGTLSAVATCRVEASLSAPYSGVWERVNIAAFVLWVAVLAIALLREDAAGTHPDRKGSDPDEVSTKAGAV